MSPYKIWVVPVTTYTITVYANYFADPVNETTSNYGLYYSIDSGSDILITAGNNITTTCSSIGTITGISSGATVYIGFKYDAGKLQSGRDFDADKVTSTCPGTNTSEFCGTNNVGNNPCGVANVTLDLDVALTINVAKGFFLQSC